MAGSRKESDQACLDLWRMEASAQALNTLISRYETRVFTFVIYLTGCDLNTAYEITADSFAETLAELRASSKEALPEALFERVIRKCRGVKAMLFFDAVKFINARDQRKNILRTAKTALTSLPFDEKAVLLLRDQANLTYDEIASIMKAPLQTIKIQTGQARNQFRELIEKRIDQ